MSDPSAILYFTSFQFAFSVTSFERFAINWETWRSNGLIKFLPGLTLGECSRCWRPVPGEITLKWIPQPPEPVAFFFLVYARHFCNEQTGQSLKTSIRFLPNLSEKWRVHARPTPVQYSGWPPRPNSCHLPHRPADKTGQTYSVSASPPHPSVIDILCPNFCSGGQTMGDHSLHGYIRGDRVMSGQWPAIVCVKTARNNRTLWNQFG